MLKLLKHILSTSQQRFSKVKGLVKACQFFGIYVDGTSTFNERFAQLFVEVEKFVDAFVEFVCFYLLITIRHFDYERFNKCHLKKLRNSRQWRSFC